MGMVWGEGVCSGIGLGLGLGLAMGCRLLVGVAGQRGIYRVDAAVVAYLYGYLYHEGDMQWRRGMDGNGRFGQAVMIPQSLRELGTVA